MQNKDAPIYTEKYKVFGINNKNTSSYVVYSTILFVLQKLFIVRI